MTGKTFDIQLGFAKAQRVSNVCQKKATQFRIKTDSKHKKLGMHAYASTFPWNMIHKLYKKSAKIEGITRENTIRMLVQK